MKSIFTISFFATLFLTVLTASTALSYDCYERTPPQIRPCNCPQCQSMRHRHPQPCPTRCGQCKQCALSRSCNKKVVHKHTYQCQTTCTQKTEQITTVQCKLCGTRYPKGVDHYCNKIQCQRCGMVHLRDVEHRCGIVQCETCGMHYRQGMKHHCGEVRCQFCGVHYKPNIEHHCRPRCQHNDCSRGNDCRYHGKQCPTPCCNTSWHTWFKQKQVI